MSQNTSSAVMQQRKEPHDSLDFFPTPLWATRALCEDVLQIGQRSKPSTVWEPACGKGHMAKALGEYFETVIASDVHDYGYGRVRDFLLPDEFGQDVAEFTGLDLAPDWIITNPPFRLAQQFIERACEVARDGVAIFVRTAFLEGQERYETLFKRNPPGVVAQFAERVPLLKGRVDQEGSTATAYCWLVWEDGGPSPTEFQWIPPCRKRLEREGDYQ